MEAATQAKLRVLLLEDSVTDAQLVEDALREAGMNPAARRVQTREAFVQGLGEFKPDVILADYTLPAFDGLKALRLAKEICPQTPLIMVTGTLGDDVAVGLLREGARDYILKDRLSRLAPAVRRALEEARVETARQEAEEKYRALFDQARDGIVLADLESGRVVDCNAEFERQTGRTLEQLRRLAVWELRAPDRIESGRRDFEQFRKDGSGADSELEFRRPDGSELEVELRPRIIQLRGGRYVQAISRDITERRRAEATLREQLEELRQFQKVTVDRELRLQELEAEVRRLKARKPSAAK